jgi:predicted ferric reductase
VNKTMKQRLWLLVYFLVLLAPLLVVMIGPRPAPREFWRELSVALGFTGLALMGVQFIPTARLRPLSNLFPMDEIYYYHLRAAMIAGALILAHPLILFLFNPDSVRLLNPFTAPWSAVFGLISLLAIIGLIVTSVFQEELGLKYETWRILHIIFAITAVLLAMMHIFRVDYYLSMPWQRWLWIGLTVIWLAMIVQTRFIKPAQMTRRPWKVTEVNRERGDTWTLVLAPDEHEGMAFMPGQFVWLTIQRSPFQIREHPFSIASGATKRDEMKLTIAEAGDFTNRIGEIPEGEVAYLDGPHGTFSFDRYDGPGYVFIAVGIGSPPMVSMLRTMAERQSSKPAWFFYGNEKWEEVVFREELDHLEQSLDLTLIHVIKEPSEEWQGEKGYIDADVLDRHLPENRDDLIYFVCGPIRMIETVVGALDDLGVPLKNVHTEQYDMM